MTTKSIYEVLDEVARAPTSEAAAAILFYNRSPELKNVLLGTFHPELKFVFSEAIEFKASDSPPGLGYSNLGKEMSRSYLFVENSVKAPKELTLDRKRQLLQQILESLEKREADVYMNMILKKPPKNVSYEVVKRAFPDLLP